MWLKHQVTSGHGFPELRQVGMPRIVQLFTRSISTVAELFFLVLLCLHYGVKLRLDPPFRNRKSQGFKDTHLLLTCFKASVWHMARTWNRMLTIHMAHIEQKGSGRAEGEATRFSGSKLSS